MRITVSGLPKTGKSTVAQLIKEALERSGFAVQILNEDAPEVDYVQRVFPVALKHQEDNPIKIEMRNESTTT